MRRRAFLICTLAGALSTALWADAESERLKPLTLPEGSAASFHRLGIGLNFLGAQLLWRPREKWAAEFRYQHGTASSDYGDVSANVFGLRGYRFFRTQTRLPLYVGPEISLVKGKNASGDYRTQGPAFGAFGGFDYPVTRRLSLAIDIGPYVIALKESRTSATQTTLDFVLNTALIWHGF